MSAVEVFKYADRQVRTVSIDGEPWFVAADVTAALGIKNGRDAVSRVDQAGVGNADIRSGGQKRNVSIINEPALYEIIFQSRVAGAVEFKRWVTQDVLPTIRKTGRYGSDVDMLAALPSAKLLRLAAEAAERAEAAEAKIALDAPKVEAYDTFMDADGTYGVGAVAKMLGLSQNKLFDLLRNAGVFIAKGAMRNTPYQKYMQYFSVVAHPFERSNGERSVSYTTKVQPSGVDFIRRKLGIHAALSAEVVAS